MNNTTASSSNIKCSNSERHAIGSATKKIDFVKLILVKNELKVKWFMFE